MKLQVYEVDDVDLLEMFFGDGPDGDGPRVKSVVDVARDHGELIWEASDYPYEIPRHEDTVTLHGGEDGDHEYTVVARTHVLDEGRAVVLVFERAEDDMPAEGLS